MFLSTKLKFHKYFQKSNFNGSVFDTNIDKHSDEFILVVLKTLHFSKQYINFLFYFNLFIRDV